MLRGEHTHDEQATGVDRQRGASPYLAEEMADHQVEEVGLPGLEGDGVLAVHLVVDVEPVGASFGIGAERS